MAFMLTTQQQSPTPLDGTRLLEALKQHYGATKFLYPEKDEKLRDLWPVIDRDWVLLFRAPSALFQLHAALDESGKIVSSVCAVRDTDETYVIQHAASMRTVPRALMRCILDCLTTINGDPSFGFNKMFYRPNNPWPLRVAQEIAKASPPGFGAFATSAYLTSHPAEQMAAARKAGVSMRVGVHAPQVVDLATCDDAALADANRLVVAALGRLQAGALGFGDDQGTWEHLSLARLNRLFMAYGLQHSRRILAAYRDGALAGVAICAKSSAPMNFSLLDSRTEVALDPALGVQERAEVARLLGEASLAEAAADGKPLTAILAMEQDVAALEQAGYTNTGKQYASFTWSRENAEGAPAGLRGIQNLYHMSAEQQAVTPITVAASTPPTGATPPTGG